MVYIYTFAQIKWLIISAFSDLVNESADMNNGPLKLPHYGKNLEYDFMASEDLKKMMYRSAWVHLFHLHINHW